MASVTFSDATKIYPDGHLALKELSLDVADGEFMVLVGPSGCGKTTALRMVAGLESITEGEVRIADEVVNHLDPRRRDIAMVFQNYALYPHMSVFENLAFPLRSRRLPRQEIKQKVESIARLLGLEETLKRRPRTLSGGQRQRVAMGRALVREPKVFLMDEPLSNLDAKLRVQMRAEISSLQRELGITTIYVTHDQVEAMTMGSRIAVMRKGVLQQQGPPQELYDHPANLFVATFIGSPAMNLMQARIEEHADGLLCALSDGQRLRLPERALNGARGLKGYVGANVALGIRPEHMAGTARRDDDPWLEGQVRLVETLGAERLVHVDVAADPVVTDEVLEIAADIDAAAAQSLASEAAQHTSAIVARLDSESDLVAATERVRLSVRADRVRLFDLKTGSAIV